MPNKGGSIFDQFEGAENMGRTLRSEGVSQQKTADALNEHYKTNVFKKWHVSKLDRRVKRAGGSVRASKPGTLPLDDQVRYERETERLRGELSAYKSKNKVLMKQANVTEALILAARDFVPRLPEVKAPKVHKADDGMVHEIMNLLFSDLHGGELVNLEEMGGLNEFNFSILAGRLEYMSDSIHSIVSKMQGYKMTHLNLNALGDMLTGEIHEELARHGEGTVIEWLGNTSFLTAQFIQELLTVFETIDFTGVVGNHGRMTKRVGFKKRYVNWDYIFYQLVAMMLVANPRVTFNLPKSFWTIKEVGGRRQLLLHGDNIRSWAGIPWYGIQRAVYKLEELLSSHNQPFDDVCLGHFHNTGTIERVDGDIYLNGSVVGPDDFSVGAIFAGNKPRQFLYGVNPKRGEVTHEWKLKLANANESTRYKLATETSNVWADSVREYL